MDTHSIAGGTLEATIKADGAELCSLRAGGQEVMWSGAAPWHRHAPVLFPPSSAGSRTTVCGMTAASTA